MKGLSEKQALTLQTIIDLWMTQDHEVRPRDVIKVLKVRSRTVEESQARLRQKGYIEIIRHGGRYVELKPLKFCNGRDFLKTWNPPPPKAPAASKNPLRVSIPPSWYIVEQRKKEILAAGRRREEHMRANGMKNFRSAAYE